MVLYEKNGLIVEVTDPEYVKGVQHCWISDKRPDSPTIHQILAHATGDNTHEAVEKATSVLEERSKLGMDKQEITKDVLRISSGTLANLFKTANYNEIDQKTYRD